MTHEDRYKSSKKAVKSLLGYKSYNPWDRRGTEMVYWLIGFFIVVR